MYIVNFVGELNPNGTSVQMGLGVPCEALYLLQLPLNRLYVQQLISTHANCLELRQVIKIFIIFQITMSKLKVYRTA